MAGLFGYPMLSASMYLIGCLVFMKGYFPTPRLSAVSEMIISQRSDHDEMPPKLVWMVIDAFRSDFTASSNAVPFLSKMGEMGHLRSYVALAEPPTVTLPRVKALTTGTVPEFLDVLRNYDGGQLMQDSLVHSLWRMGRRLVFYGDDTWLRLFPDVFLRHDGTHSFFVNDFTEVDDNVTRHLPDELARRDWDVLILHYLGLDHIGHLAGPASPLIGRKLAEMSDVMERIYHALTAPPPGSAASAESERQTVPSPVLVVCGDHGMSEAGSHGGASPPETRVALHFVSPMFAGRRQADPGREVRQVDLAPTLAALLGVPAPAESVGRVIDDVIRPLGAGRMARALLDNGRQLLRLYRDQRPTDAEVEEDVLSAAAAALEAGSDTAAAERAAAAASGAAQRMQAKLLAAGSGFDPVTMALGVLLLLTTLLVSCLPTPSGGVSASLAAGCLLGSAAGLLLVCGLWPAGRLCSSDGAGSAALLVGSAALCLAHAAASAATERRRKTEKPSTTPLSALLCAGSLLHLASLGASSFIEEEHQTWYFLNTTAWLLLLAADVRRLRRRPAPTARRRAWLAAALLLSGSLLRRWNQTGDKWLHLADVGDWLSAPGRAAPLAAVWAAALLLLLPALLAERRERPAAAVGALCLLLRGLADDRLLGDARLPAPLGLWAARAVFLLALALALGPTGGDRLARLRAAWLLLVAVLVRPHNLAVWAGCALQTAAVAAWLREAPQPPLAAALLFHWAGMAAFFYMGNSNSLASVDISAGYVGVTSHQPAVAVLLTVCHTFAGPVLATLSALQYAERCRCFTEVLHVLVTMRGAVLAVYCCLSAAFVHHIFVWTVFSPKLLYEAAWTAVTAAAGGAACAAAWRVRW